MEELIKDPLVDAGHYTTFAIQLGKRSLHDAIQSLRTQLDREFGGLRKAEDELRRATNDLETRRKEIAGREAQINELIAIENAERTSRK